MKKAVIITTQRTGSTTLCAFLNSHPNIFWGQEVLAKRSDNMLLRFRLFYEIIDQAFFGQDNLVWCGTKVMYNQLRRSAGEVWELIVDNNMPVIHLTRENDFRHALSHELNGMQEELGRGPHSKGNPKKVRVEINPQNIERRIMDTKTTRSRWFDKLSDYPHVDITYEEMTNDGESVKEMPEKPAKRLLEFLGVSYHTLTTPFVRQNPAPPEEIITNYEEVYEYLHGRGLVE